MAILDLGERFLDLVGKIKIGDFAFLEEHPESEEFDIAFVEGAPITEKNKERLLDLRKHSKVLVALGACACLGGIAEIKDYQDKGERVCYVYKNIESIENPNIIPLRNLVKVDLEIPGCPINKEEFLDIVKKLIMVVSQGLTMEQMPKPAQRPVCYDCQVKRNICLLQEGLPCLGPMILAGCGAPCPSSGYPCDGCRGPLKNVNPDNLNKQLIKQGYSQQEIDMILQRFGVLEETYPQTLINL